MKRTLTFLLVLLFVKVSAQTCDSTYKDHIHNTLKHLDKSQIPTAILHEYVMDFSGLERYDATISTDTSGSMHFFQAYHELYEASFNTMPLTHPADLLVSVENFHSNPRYHHPVGIMQFDYNTIDTNAVTNNQLYWSNDALYDVPDRIGSPYINHRAFIAAPLLTEFYRDFTVGTHYLYFKNEFVLSNTGFSLSQVHYIQVILNGAVIHSSSISNLHNHVVPVTITESTPATKIEIRLTVGGSVNYFRIYEEASRHEDAGSNPANCDGGYTIQIEGYPYDGGYGEGLYSEHGKAHIYYADCNTRQVNKVIVFVDGFDPMNTNDHTKIWSKYLNKEFTDFNNSKVQLGNELRAMGYTIVILDQKPTRNYSSGGSGLIENNGLVLAKLLTTLYNSYGSTLQEDFVVVGASMGGLVVRFGLAWMEANSMPHHTRLFISFDSPQEGAYIPLGLQHFLDSFTQNGAGALFKSVKNALHNSNAAKQMLIQHSSMYPNAGLPHPFRIQFLNNLANVGNYPSQCRNISISNGNRVGMLKNVLPNPNDFNAQTISGNEVLIDMGIKEPGLGWCGLWQCYKHRFFINAQPSSGVGSVMEMWYRPSRLFGPLFLNRIVMDTPYLGHYSLDMAPGSRLNNDFVKTLRDNTGWRENFWSDLVVRILLGKFVENKNKSIYTNFIPTVSSVAYTFPNGEAKNYYKNFTGIILSKCAGTTPFDTVYAPSYDMPHVEVDAFIAAAFRNEVYNHLPPSSCNGDCPEHLVRNSIIAAGSTVYEAQKSVTLNPGFEAPHGRVFKAQTGGCNNSSLAEPHNNEGTHSTLPGCVFIWDTDKLSSSCSGGYTRYTVYVRNIPHDTYPEFSADGSSWTKAAIGSTGHEFLLPGTSGQTFYARLKNKPLEVINYSFGSCGGTGSTPIVFNNTLRTKLCAGGNITLTVYVDNLPGGATAQFSTDGGSAWYNANVGANGYSYTQLPTGSYQQFLVRSHPGSTVSSEYHASCSSIPGMSWGAYTVAGLGGGYCQYNVSVTGLATDSYAEFSADGGGSWYRATVGASGISFILPWSSTATHQNLWFRPAERPDYGGTWGQLPMCSN